MTYLEAQNAQLLDRLNAQRLTIRIYRDEACKWQAVAEQGRAENTKLRELAKRSWKVAEKLCRAFDGPCTDDGTTIYKSCPIGERDDECVYGRLQRELHELGIGVD